MLCSTSTFAVLKSVYVSPFGNDNHSGDRSSPYLTFQKAQQSARMAAATDTVWIQFADGAYYLDDKIVFTAADTKAKVLYKAENEGKAILSGGSKLTLNWQVYKGAIYVADIAGNPDIDQVYVNGKRKRMARFPNAISGKNVYDTWDLNNSSYYAANDALTSARIGKWRNPTGGYVHAMHQALWGDMHWLIKGKNADGTLNMEGGWQNNRPSPMHGTFRFVEHIFEELDAPGEWFFDKINHKLYYYPEAGTALSSATVEIVRLKTLLEFLGSKENPVQNIELNGFVFKHAARTFMENKEPLLRSDWTICRLGAITISGAEHCRISDCDFDQVGGNTIVVSNYNKKIDIVGCHIHSSGASGVVFVGNPAAVRNPLFGVMQQNYATLDRTPGPRSDNYPDDCLVENCLITQTGRDEKQTAGVQISMSHGIKVIHCSVYDVPRAGINISEGTFGGHLIDHCDVFNTVLETGDHGSFNSWGRDRFWSPDINSTIPYTLKEPGLPYLDMLDSIVISNSRFRCDHGWDIDLDDGSSWYRIFNNVLLNGGLKMREGYGRLAYNNIIINNSLHPHVWYSNSGDVFKSNLVFMAYKPAVMTTSIASNGKWGKELDYNFFACNESEMKQYNINGCDTRSINGYPSFVDSINGNYQLRPDSKVLEIGFKNFPMNQFGVQKANLKAIAKTPTLPKINISISEPAQKLIYKYYWLDILLLEPTADAMSGYGVGFDEGGVVLTNVAPLSKAADYGFRSSDLIQAINGTPTKTISEFIKYIDAHSNDTSPQVFSIVRNPQRMSITISPPWQKTALVESAFVIPGKIEGEQYTNQFGVHSETCSDVGGGQNVGYIHIGDWMEYPLEIPHAGIYTVTFRTASLTNPAGGIVLQIDGLKVDTLSFSSTGSWQTYRTTSRDIKLPAGKHKLRLYVWADGFNLNWFTFMAKTTAPKLNIHQSDAFLYPNPTNGCLYFSSGGKEIVGMEVFSLTGKKLMTVPYQLNSFFDITSLNSGHYITMIFDENKCVLTAKIIKN